MKTKIIFLAISVLFAVSCTNNRQNKADNSNEVSDSIPFVVKGNVIMGHEVRSFTAEGDTLDYWIYDRGGKLDSLYREATKESVSPYTPVYAALKVYNKGKSTEGFAAEYAGTYEVVEVIEVKPLDSSTGQ